MWWAHERSKKKIKINWTSLIKISWPPLLHITRFSSSRGLHCYTSQDFQVLVASIVTNHKIFKFLASTLPPLWVSTCQQPNYLEFSHSHLIFSCLQTPKSLKDSYMAIFCHPFSSLTLKKLINPLKPTSTFTYINLHIRFQAMNSRSDSSSSKVMCQMVPGLDTNEKEYILDQTFERYTSKMVKRNGKGTAIVWFRNDLRVLDNEVLFKAWVDSESVLPVYCVDPRVFQASTRYFGFPKTGGKHAYTHTHCFFFPCTNSFKVPSALWIAFDGRLSWEGFDNCVKRSILVALARLTRAVHYRVFGWFEEEFDEKGSQLAY